MIKIQKNKAYTQVLEILNHIKLEDYYKLPKEIIKALEVNKDDDASLKFIQKCSNIKTMGIGEADFEISSFDIHPSHTNIKFKIYDEEYKTTTNLTSKFNIYKVNLLIKVNLFYKQCI